MRSATSRLFVSTAVVVLASCLVLGQGAKVPTDTRPPSESARDHPQERAKWFLRGRTVNGRPAARELQRAYQQKLNNRHLRTGGAPRTSGTQTTLSSETAGTTSAPPAPGYIQSTGGPSWTPLGPAPTATSSDTNQDYGPAVGRATAVVVDQSDTSGNTVYVGGASGGLWKSSGANGAVSAPRSCDANGVCTASPTWVPLIDNQPTLTVGAIALRPGNNNVILVGTGEPNNSADSYYGLGFLRSTDGGASWHLISGANNGAISFHGLGFTRIAFATDNPGGSCPAAPGTLTTCTVVATAAAASGGITVGAETGGVDARGIYYSLDAGATWSRANVTDPGNVTPSAGSANSVVYNAASHTFFANLRYHGFYSSTDGVNWTRLPAQPSSSSPSLDLSLTRCPSVTSSNCPLYRAEMAVVPGRNEMYVWIYDSSENDKGIYQTRDGGATWTQISTSGIDNCGDGSSNGCGTGTTSQATYNITLAAVPNGATATDLYAGGVNQYKCSIDPVLNPACVTKPFANLTHVYGSCGTGAVGAFAHVHPDEHGVDFLQSNPAVMFFANDGGIYRTLNSFSIQQKTCNGVSQPWLQFDNLNPSMGSMIQFVWFSQHPSDPATLLGGTQDNGSPAKDSTAPASLSGEGYAFQSVNNGDGGFNDINPLNTTEWFTSNPDMGGGGSIQRCTSGIDCTYGSFLPVVARSDVGGDNSEFYTPYMLDPQATGVLPGTGRLIVGTCRVWRGNSDGSGSDWSSGGAGGSPLSNNFDTGTATACASTAVNMITALAAGGPCNGTACNAGATPGATSPGGSEVIWAGTDGIADSTTAAQACPNHLPCGGEVWVTTQASGGAATWKEVSGITSGIATACTNTPTACNINPKHYPISGIAVDPHDTNGQTAYVTIMGFNAGHVFKTANGGATWALLDGTAGSTGLPDNPADAVVADPVTPNLVYVATDVGVFQSTGDGNWTELGPGTGAGSLPNVATTALKIYRNGSDMRLRVSTYGRGLWEIPVGNSPGFTLTVSNATMSVFPGATATFNGTLSTYNGYNYSINLNCTAGSTAAPQPCTVIPATIPAGTTSQDFTVSAAAGSSVTDFSFNITAVGTDPGTITQQVPVTLHVVDFSLGAPAAATVGQGDSVDVNFNVSPLGAFTGNVNLSCPSASNPAWVSCTFSPAIASLVPGATVNVRLTIPTSANTAIGSYTVVITGTTSAAGGGTHTQNMSLTVTTASFLVSASTALAPVSGPSPPRPGEQLAATVTVKSQQSYAGTLGLSCAFDPTAGDPGPSTCTMSPNSVTLVAGGTLTSTLNVNTSGAPAANPKLIVTAKDQPNNASNSVTFNYSLVDYVLAAPASATVVPAGSTDLNLSLTGQNGFSSSVAVQCSASAPLTCSLSPVGPYAVGATPVAVTATVGAPTGTTAGTYTISITSNDVNYTPLTHNTTVTAGVQSFTLSACNAATTATCDNKATVTAGGSASFKISMTGLGGFTGSTNLAVSGCPQLTTCSLAQTSIQAGGSTTLTITTTAPSVSQMRPPNGGRTPLYALWLTMPGIAIGIVCFGGRRKRSRVVWWVGLALAVGVLLAMAACGGGGGNTTTSPPIPKAGTPAGSYTITVSGTSGSGGSTVTQSASIALTVQ